MPPPPRPSLTTERTWIGDGLTFASRSLADTSGCGKSSSTVTLPTLSVAGPVRTIVEVRRSTEVLFHSRHPSPTFGPGRAVFPLALEPQETFVLEVDILPLINDQEPPLS